MNSASFREIRCQCHRLLAKMSSTSSYRQEIKCPRCGKLGLYQSSTGD